MSFWETITGSDLTKEWKVFEARAEALPADYRAALERWDGADLRGDRLLSAADVHHVDEYAAQRVGDRFGHHATDRARRRRSPRTRAESRDTSAGLRGGTTTRRRGTSSASIRRR